MVVKIIQLSDFHLTTQTNVKEIFESMKESLLYEYGKSEDEVLLCVPGDLTKQAEADEFENFELFLYMIEELFDSEGKHLNIYLVPGNHDINLTGQDNSVRSKEIESFLKNKNMDFLNGEESKMKDFFALSNKYDLFKANKYVDYKYLDIQDKKIKINLLNTAFFSTKDYKDKERHYIDSTQISSSSEKYDYEITIMHHSSEWFEYNSKQYIDKLLNKSDFYLYGHEHKQTKIRKNESSMGFLSGKIDDGTDRNDSSKFFIHFLEIKSILNTNLQTYSFSYKNESNKFILTSTQPATYNINSKNIKHNKYYELFENIEVERDKYDLINFFVMPTIRIKSSEDYKYIKVFEDLTKFINDNKYVAIEAGQKCGKTTLIERLFIYYYEMNNYCVFINGKDIRANYLSTLKSALDDNYSNLSFEEFTQAKKENKILLIDDFEIDDEEKINKFIIESSKHFSKIIISHNDCYFNRKTLLALESNSNFKNIVIERFSLKQRKELIENFISQSDDQQNIDIQIIEKCLETILSKDIFFDMTSPFYLAILIKKIVSEKLYEERDVANSFSIVFESNILNMIRENCGNNKSDDYLNLFKELSYILYGKKNKNSYIITYDDINKAYEICKNDWGLKENFHDVLGKIIKTKIIIEYENDYKFSEKSYYSYFVAKQLNSLKNQGVDISKEIVFLANNISYGNYTDILLFLAYINENVEFFDNIMNEISKISESWEGLSFDNKNSIILQKMIDKNIDIGKYYESKKDHEERLDKAETKRIEIETKENNEVTIRDNDYDADLNNKIKLLRLLEILAKGVNGYVTVLKQKKKEEIIECIGSNLYKFIFSMFSITSDEYDDFSNSIKETFKSKGKSIPSKEKMDEFVIKGLYNIMETFSLNIMTYIASFSNSKKVIDIIEKIPDYDNNGKLIFNNVLFKFVYLERYGNQNKFVSYLQKVYKDINNNYKNIINRIFMMFIITSPMSHFNIDRCSSITNISKKTIYEALNVVGDKIQISKEIKQVS